MKVIIAYPIPVESQNPIVVQGVLKLQEGQVFNDPNKNPLFTYVEVDDNVEVAYGYVVTKNEDDTYTFTKP
jgi:hypothetical protein